MRRTVLALVVVCVAFVWAVFPVFIRTPDSVLVFTVNPTVVDECASGLACYKLELENRGLWPVAISIVELQVYPSLIGPSVNVDWRGPVPSKALLLMPFTAISYTFSIRIMGGLHPPDTVYVILTANVTIFYVTHHAVLHSGKR